MQVDKLKAEAASQEAEVARLHGITVHQLYLQDLDAFLEAYEAWEADEAANSGTTCPYSRHLSFAPHMQTQPWQVTQPQCKACGYLHKDNTLCRYSVLQRLGNVAMQHCWQCWLCTTAQAEVHKTVVLSADSVWPKC